jgi:hypothetical protein
MQPDSFFILVFAERSLGAAVGDHEHLGVPDKLGPLLTLEGSAAIPLQRPGYFACRQVALRFVMHHHFNPAILLD